MTISRGLFARALRPAILAASHSDRLRRVLSQVPVTAAVVRRFVPGDSLDMVLDSVGALRNSGLMVSIDYLGEDVSDSASASATVHAYLELLTALGRRCDATHDGVRPLEVSLKLSALGQALRRDGAQIARDNAHTICQRAQQAGAWVTVDAEDHRSTDTTLSIATDLAADFPWLGVVVQAYLHRTLGDCEQLAASGRRVRLCKGAYDEPASVAYREPAEVTAAYLRCLRVLMSGPGYPMVASHDPAVIDTVATMAGEYLRAPTCYEYQMLYGIRSGEQHRLASAGNQVRVYVPFGTHWYGYFMRRLAERPANVAFFLRALAQRAP